MRISFHPPVSIANTDRNEAILATLSGPLIRRRRTALNASLIELLSNLFFDFRFYVVIQLIQCVVLYCLPLSLDLRHVLMLKADDLIARLGKLYQVIELHLQGRLAAST